MYKIFNNLPTRHLLYLCFSRPLSLSQFLSHFVSVWFSLGLSPALFVPIFLLSLSSSNFLSYFLCNFICFIYPFHAFYIPFSLYLCLSHWLQHSHKVPVSLSQFPTLSRFLSFFLALSNTLSHFLFFFDVSCSNVGFVACLLLLSVAPDVLETAVDRDEGEEEGESDDAGDESGRLDHDRVPHEPGKQGATSVIHNDCFPNGHFSYKVWSSWARELFTEGKGSVQLTSLLRKLI